MAPRPDRGLSTAGGAPDVIVGGYEILREIGHGGMATVYLARQLELDRLIALKKLGGLNRTDPSFARRFVREAHMAGSLSHPNIVTVYDYLTHEDTPYIAMEYLARGSLRPHVGKLTLAQLGGVLEGLLAGLARAHAGGIVHRDLKPENLLVGDDGRIKIADFGIATAKDQLRFASRITVTGTTIGTPEYMAPEQALGRDVGPAADLYSVGMIALELATGRLPFDDAESQIAVMMRQVKQPTPPARKLDPSVDRAVSDWIERMLVKDPARRPPSATQAWDELEEVLIARLGARWRRDASLLEPAADGDRPRVAATPPTAPLEVGDPARAPTVWPPPLAAAVAPPPAPTVLAPRPAARAASPRAHRPLIRARRTILALAVTAGLVLAALGTGGPPTPTGGTPARSVAPSPAAPTVSGGGSEPVSAPAPPAPDPAGSVRAPEPAAPAASAPAPQAAPEAAPAAPASGVGDSRSDDPSDDAPDGGED